LEPPDDELLAETPADMVMMLGFDPATEPGFRGGGVREQRGLQG
jgi:hypothetical protein